MLCWLGVNLAAAVTFKIIEKSSSPFPPFCYSNDVRNNNGNNGPNQATSSLSLHEIKKASVEFDRRGKVACNRCRFAYPISAGCIPPSVNSEGAENSLRWGGRYRTNKFPLPSPRLDERGTLSKSFGFGSFYILQES